MMVMPQQPIQYINQQASPSSSPPQALIQQTPTAPAIGKEQDKSMPNKTESLGNAADEKKQSADQVA